MATSTSPAVASTSMLTLKYSGAVVSTLIAVFSVLALLSELFGLWTDKASASMVVGSGYIGVVTLSMLAALFSVMSFLLYRRVTKGVGAQPEYINKTSYHFITNGFLGVLVLVFVVIVAELLSVLISSLLLIGTSTDIGGLYLSEFIPGLVAAGIVGLAGFASYKIVRGKNVSAIMTIVLMSLAGALLIAVLITVPIKAHTSVSSSPSNTYDYSKYLENMYNGGN